MVASHVVENVTMLWFHDGHEVVIDNENSLESVKIESKNVNISQTSRLKINNLQPKHAGVYSCSPSSCHLTSCSSPAFKTASTIVHVLNGNDNYNCHFNSIGGIITHCKYKLIFASLKLLQVNIQQLCSIQWEFRPSIPIDKFLSCL